MSWAGKYGTLVAWQMVAPGVTPRFQVGQYDRYGRYCNNGGNMKASAINGRGNSVVTKHK
jgi:hypothetical protein